MAFMVPIKTKGLKCNSFKRLLIKTHLDIITARNEVFTGVCHSVRQGGGVCARGSMHGRGEHAWWDAYVAGGGHVGQGPCVAGGCA